MIVDQKINKQFVGVYLIDGIIDGIQLATTIKPNLFRRIIIKLFLGWKWISIKELKKQK
jgi:spore maturation protein SpmB